MMSTNLKADLIAWLHLLLEIFVFLSLPLLLIVPGWNKIVLIFVGGMVVSWFLLRDCWFLQLEKKWRKESNPEEDYGDEVFAQHYLRKYFNIKISKQVVRTINQIYVAITLVVAFVQLFI